MNNAFTKILSAYSVDYPKILTYMWQQSEYGVLRFVRWWVGTSSFRKVSYRGSVVSTKNSRNIRIAITTIALTYWSVNMLIIYTLHIPLWSRILYGLLTLILYPIIVVIITVPVILLLKLIHQPIIKATIRKGEATFASHDGIVIAVAGSYGKTSMKDMLVTLLEGSVNVRATEGNQNTLYSQALFGQKLIGNEDVVVVEFGEGAPADIQKMVNLVQPDYAIITGIAPNHLDLYKSIDALADDFAVLARYVGHDRTYINGDSVEARNRLGSLGELYSEHGFMGWKTSKVKVGIDGVSLALAQKNEKLALKSNLLGRHNVGPIVLASALALQLGVPNTKLAEKITRLLPYEHRMQPRDLGGMWMIDDTYNGNIEGLLAGLSLMKEIKIRGRKLYATPGLVDQGAQTTIVHKQLGEAIARSGLDHVYLIKNSVTEIVEDAMNDAGYEGQYTIIDDPLKFYTNIQDILAVGDVIMCQNDWPDQYK